LRFRKRGGRDKPSHDTGPTWRSIPEYGSEACVHRNTSVVLGEHFADFVDQQVATGRFASASEVIRAGLRLLEEEQTRLQALRRALEEGEQSGPGESFEIEEFLVGMRRAARA
jgi:antitoxin ParD1/3/4